MKNHDCATTTKKVRFGNLAVALMAGSGIAAQVNAQNCDPAADMFVTNTRFDTSAIPYYSIVGDFNGDGVDDVALSVDYGNGLSVLLGDGVQGLLPETLTPTENPSSFIVFSMASADLNGDGFDDLATGLGSGSADSDQLTVRLSNGDGTFMPAIRMDIIGLPGTVRTVDLNNDGVLDLAVTHRNLDSNGNLDDKHLTIAMGNGDGTFQTPIVYATGRMSEGLMGLAVNDYNGDGNPDLAVTDTFYGDVSIFVGDGTGSVSLLPQRFDTSRVVNFATSGDFNNDGWADLAVTNSNLAGDLAPRFISILLGNGDGTFQPRTPYAVGQAPKMIQVVDLNEDGNEDLIVANTLGLGSGISVLLGDGAGSFADQQTYLVGSGGRTVGVMDLNGDNHLDLVSHLRSSLPGYGVSVGLGLGDGTFIAPHVIKAGYRPREVMIADFNGDGIPDMVTRNTTNTALDFLPSLTVAVGDGNGSFFDVQEIVLPNQPFGMVTEDFNGDGFADILVSVRDFVSSHFLVILINNGDGTFALTTPLFEGPVGVGMAAADLNGDGNMDFAIAKATGNQIALGFGQGNGSFLISSQTMTAGNIPMDIEAVDLDGDGAIDLVTADAGGDVISVHMGNGDGTYQPRQSFAVGDQPLGLGVADVDGDGILDVLAANKLSGDVSLLIGNGDGTFQAQQRLDAGVNPEEVTIVDMNGDGILDLVVPDADGYNNTWFLMGQGNGAFAQAVSIAEDAVSGVAGVSSVAAGDLNMDGVTDLLIASDTSNLVSVLLNQCQGNTCPADLTGDGLLNFFDVSAFLSAFAKGNPIADFTDDGEFNFFDVSAFLAAFSKGCP